MQTIRVTELWQRAGVYYVRTAGMVVDLDLPLTTEFEDDKADSKYILVSDGNLPVGTCRIHILDELTAKIERVCVVPTYRKKGIGRIAIEGAEEWLREQGVKKIIISARDIAVGFYERLGYVADYSKVEDGFFKCIHTEKNL